MMRGWKDALPGGAPRQHGRRRRRYLGLSAGEGAGGDARRALCGRGPCRADSGAPASALSLFPLLFAVGSEPPPCFSPAASRFAPGLGLQASFRGPPSSCCSGFRLPLPRAGPCPSYAHNASAFFLHAYETFPPVPSAFLLLHYLVFSRSSWRGRGGLYPSTPPN